MCDVCGTCVCVVRRSVGRVCVRSVNERCSRKEESVRRMGGVFVGGVCMLSGCECVYGVCMRFMRTDGYYIE